MSNERDAAALRRLFPILGGTPNYLTIWLSGNYSLESWKPRLDDWQGRINELREWSKSLRWLDRCAYSRYIEHFQRELDSAWKELRTQKEKRTMDDCWRRYEQDEQDEQKTRQFEESHDFPKPPVKQRGDV